MTTPAEALPNPLDGVRVLELAQAISAPFVGRILADLGADVVKVEWENGDVTNRFGPATAGLTGVFTHMNAGKRGLGVDLKAPGAGDLIVVCHFGVILSLVQRARGVSAVEAFAQAVSPLSLTVVRWAPDRAVEIVDHHP